MIKNKKDEADGAKGNDAQILVHTFRELTEEQFDFWIKCLNRAVATASGNEDEFSRDDRQKTISYWYLLMFLLEIYAADKNPFEISRDEISWTDGLISMKRLSRDLRDRYKEETVRRYISDLKRLGLLILDGRGPEATVKLYYPTIVALTDNIRQWIEAFRELDRKFVDIGAL